MHVSSPEFNTCFSQNFIKDVFVSVAVLLLEQIFKLQSSIYRRKSNGVDNEVQSMPTSATDILSLVLSNLQTTFDERRPTGWWISTMFLRE